LEFTGYIILLLTIEYKRVGMYLRKGLVRIRGNPLRFLVKKDCLDERMNGCMNDTPFEGNSINTPVRVWKQ
jgi:hypothetical protein